jgi:hypothetical protein
LTVLAAMLVVQGCYPAELAVKVSADKLSLRVNETVQLVARGEQDGQVAELGTITYSSSDTAIAEVDANTGLVTAKGTGTTTLTATAQGKSGTLTLKVEGGAVHSGTINKNETWRAKDNPHYVLASVDVEGSNNPRLTLEPGVIVRFAPKTSLFVGDGEPGTLKAEGTAQAPIQFVADAASPTNGFWQGVMLGMQGGAESVVRHAKLSHCGAEYPFPSSRPCLMASGARAVIADVSIESSGGSGLEVCDGGWLLDGSARVDVSNSSGFAIVAAPNFAKTLPLGGKLTNNAQNVVLIIPNEVVEDSQTWPLLKDGAGRNVPYVLMSKLAIGGANSPTLTLLPGTELRFMNDMYLDVGGSKGAGALIAEGTDAAPITFTAHAPSPAKGAWKGLYFHENRLTTTSLKHVTVDFSGGNQIAGNAAGITVVGDTQGAFIQNATIRNSGGCGIRRDTTAAHPTFTTDFTAAELGNTFENNTGSGQCAP